MVSGAAEPAERRVIGLTGQRGCGKDTAAAALVALGFRHIKFAAALKQMIRALLDYAGASPEDINRMIEGDLKEAPSAGLGGATPRHAMQTLGLEWGREMLHPDLWADAAMGRCARLGCHIVISDVRFPNEAAMIREGLGGEVWRIVRPGAGGDSHPTETEMRRIRADRTLRNDASTAIGFQRRVETLWREDRGRRLGLPEITPNS